MEPESKLTAIPRQSFIYFVDPDGDSEIYPVLPILAQKENEFQKYKNKPIVAYAYNLNRIKASHVTRKSDMEIEK